MSKRQFMMRKNKKFATAWKNMTYAIYPHDPGIARIVSIPLEELTSYITTNPTSGEPVDPKLFASGFSLPGDWDANHKPIFPDYFKSQATNAVNFRSVFQLLHEGREPHETDEFKRNEDEGIARYASAPQYAASLLKLRDSLAIDGYLSQIQLGVAKTIRAASGGWMSYDEKGVVIDRYGKVRMLHVNANHRLAIAFLLELPRIWVQIHAVHQRTLRRWTRGHCNDPLPAINAGIRRDIGPNF